MIWLLYTVTILENNVFVSILAAKHFGAVLSILFILITMMRGFVESDSSQLTVHV